MSLWSSARDRLTRAIAALYPPPDPHRASLDWQSAESRRERYAILDAFARHQQFQGVIGAQVRDGFRAYKLSRPVYSPCARIVRFHRDYVWGGSLDPMAGPGIDPATGSGVPSCLPIVPAKGTDETAVRKAAASVWKASNWQAKKDLVPTWGASLGDVGIEAIPDTDNGLVRLRVIHPAEYEWVVRDPYGNVRAYRIERWERDPADRNRTVKYAEEARKEGDKVVYKTFKDDRPYAWPGSDKSEYDTPFPFVPMVIVKYIDDGGEWGVARIADALAKAVERDSQGSLLGDQILKAVAKPGLLTADTPIAAPRATGGQDGKIRFEVVNRDDVPFVTCNATNVRWIPLVVPMPLAEASAHGRSVGEGLEQDYPELMADPVGLAASGEARREARQKAADLVSAQRAVCDAKLVEVQRMAMTMGGMLGFPDFAGFNEGSFGNKKLEHSIGQRPVFAPDPAEVQATKKAQADEERVRAETAAIYRERVGLPLRDALMRVGFTEEQWEEMQERLEAEREEQEQEADRFRGDGFAGRNGELVAVEQ